jgi:phospholipid-binding lipoprotein MlaA
MPSMLRLVIIALLSFQPWLQAMAQEDEFSDIDDVEDDAYFSEDGEGTYNIYDPIEPVNRFIYGFNKQLDRYLLKPVAKSYAFVVPNPIKDRVHNFSLNLLEPLTFANQLLQLRIDDACRTLMRFLINTSLGLFGLHDVAAGGGLYRSEDGKFDDTLSYYGIGSGMYIVLPIIGPSHLRNTISLPFDYYMDPFVYRHHDFVYTTKGVGALDIRYQNLDVTEQIQNDALDEYASMRSIYMQYNK